MAEAGIQVDQDQFSCPVCLDLLKDPVTIPCGHNFCKVCINRFWDEEDQKKLYSCPQCRETFTPRPVLGRNNMLADVVKKLKRTELQATSSAHSHIGPEDVKCDSYTGRKRKAVEIQEKICLEHKKLNENYCTTDQNPDPDSAELSSPSVCDDSPSFTLSPHLSSDRTKESLSDLTEADEEICDEEFNKIRPQAAAPQMLLLSEPKSREDFLRYFCSLTLDPNTANFHLVLSEMNRAATHGRAEQRYSHHPDRFDSRPQVLCEESVCGRRYWEVEWSGCVSVSVSYKEISRRGGGYGCLFGYNTKSWSLRCSSSSLSVWHNDVQTKLPAPAASTIGVYVDHGAGTLSFYSVSDTMELLHTVHTTFTQPLYAGFRIWYKSSVRLFRPNISQSV